MPTGTTTFQRTVLQISAPSTTRSSNQVERNTGVLRSYPKDPLGSVTASARQHIQVLLTNGSMDGTTEPDVRPAEPRADLLSGFGL